MRPAARFLPILVLAMTACAVDEPFLDGMNGPGGGKATLPASDGSNGADKGDGGATKPASAPFNCEAGSRTGKGGNAEVTLKGADGKDRTVLVHVPAAYDASKGTPLITAFHGYGGNAEQMRDQTKFDAESDKRGFIVAYVLGTGVASKGFNAGDCCGAPAWTSDTDDMGLAREVVKRMSTDYCVDPNRVYNAGFSNGGFMSYRMVCEAAEIYAAVASVSGVLGVPPETCKPTRAVPIIHIHGTNDKTVAFEGGGAAGGLGSLVNIKFRGVAESVNTLRTLWTCEATSKELSKTGDARCEEWSGCKDDAKIELCTITDGGHQWPGGKPTPVGGKTSDFGATTAVLDFFDAHPMH